MSYALDKVAETMKTSLINCTPSSSRPTLVFFLIYTIPGFHKKKSHHLTVEIILHVYAFLLGVKWGNTVVQDLIAIFGGGERVGEAALQQTIDTATEADRPASAETDHDNVDINGASQVMAAMTSNLPL